MIRNLKMKKIIAMISVIVMSMVIQVFPTELPTGKDSVQIAEEETKLELTILPTILSVEVPLVTSFVLGEPSVFPDIDIVNNTTAPVEIIVDRVTRTGEDTPSLIPPNTYSADQWENLSIEDTETKIALGIKEKDNADYETLWFKLNSRENMGVVKPLTTQTYNLTSKHGRKWSKNIDLNYVFYITVRLAE